MGDHRISAFRLDFVQIFPEKFYLSVLEFMAPIKF
jgi:hypothetical protein